MENGFGAYSPEMLNTIIDTVGDGIYCVDVERRIFFWNRAAQRISGYSAEEMIGKQCFETNLDHIDSKGRPLCDLLCPLVGTIFDGRPRQEKVMLRHKDGHRVPVIVNTFPMEENGVTIGAMEIFRDCLPPVYDGDLVQALAESMMRDKVTGLPNKTYLNNFLTYKLRESKQFMRSFVLAFAEIGGLDEIKSELGTTERDRILGRIAERLKNSARRSDLIGRWSDVELVGIFSGASANDERIIGERLRGWIEDINAELPEGEKLRVNVGVTAVTGDDTLETVIERADKNLFAGADGGNGIVTDKDIF